MFVEAHSILNAYASDDDIVHPFKELEDTCKELVPGSNPGRGANEKTSQSGCLFICSAKKVLGALPTRIRNLIEHTLGASEPKYPIGWLIV